MNLARGYAASLPKPVLTHITGYSAYWIGQIARRQRLTQRQQSALTQLLDKDAALPPIYEQVQAFRQLLRAHDTCRLDAWLERAELGDCAQMRAYALGLRKDLDAVRAGVRELYSQGPVEGHVHRLKLIKRSGYGRMSFPLLRQRVLLSPAS